MSGLHFAVLADELGSALGCESGVEPIALERNGVQLREWRHTVATGFRNAHEIAVGIAESRGRPAHN